MYSPASSFVTGRLSGEWNSSRSATFMKSSMRPACRSCSAAFENSSMASRAIDSFEYSSASLMRLATVSGSSSTICLSAASAVARLAFAVIERRHRLVLLHRVRQEAELLVQLRQLLVHVDEARLDLENLLIDGDRFEIEALVRIELRDLCIGLGRLGFLAELGVKVANLEPDADVLVVVGDDLQVFLDRLFELALFDQLLGAGDQFVFVARH